MTRDFPLARNEDGTLLHIAWPGGYPVVHYCADFEPLCRDCADEADKDPDCEWKPVHSDVYWEGAPMQCAHCNRDIESAYGDPDESD